MIYRFQDIPRDLRITADVCIIGSGAGGAVVAKELAEAGLEVVVLEEGGHFTTRDYGASIRDRIRNLYKDNGMQLTEGNATIAVMQGRCVGGSTVINSGICFRPPAPLIEKWTQDEGFSDLNLQTLNPLFDKVEKQIGLSVLDGAGIGKNNHLMHAAREKLGWKGGYMPRNAPHCIGCGGCNFGCPSDSKQSTLLSYIPHAVAKGARIYSNCRAEKILLERGQAVGVEGRFLDPRTYRPGPAIQVRARFVVLAAGAIATPMLLLNQGLANGSGQVGQNLHLHVASGLIGVHPQEVRWWRGIPQGYYVDEFKDQGFFLQSFTAPPELLAVDVAGIGDGYLSILSKFKHFIGFGGMISDTSAGSVQPGRSWKAKISYHLNERDQKTLHQMLKTVAKLLFAAGAEMVLSNVTQGGMLRSETEVEKAFTGLQPRDLSLIGNHPMGTCRLGSQSRTSVVDQHCQTHEVKNLFIADASLFPSSLGVNPQVSIMTFAAYAASYIASIAKS